MKMWAHKYFMVVDCRYISLNFVTRKLLAWTDILHRLVRLDCLVHWAYNLRLRKRVSQSFVSFGYPAFGCVVSFSITMKHPIKVPSINFGSLLFWALRNMTWHWKYFMILEKLDKKTTTTTRDQCYMLPKYVPTTNTTNSISFAVAQKRILVWATLVKNGAFSLVTKLLYVIIRQLSTVKCFL